MTRAGGACIALAMTAAACGDKSYEEKKPPPARITVDGSSTVLPMTQQLLDAETATVVAEPTVAKPTATN